MWLINQAWFHLGESPCSFFSIFHFFTSWTLLLLKINNCLYKDSCRGIYSPIICSNLEAFRSNKTVPCNKQLRSSKRLYSESVATWGLLHLLPTSSTSSSNFNHLADSLHIPRPSSLTWYSSSSAKIWCPSTSNSCPPRMNRTRSDGSAEACWLSVEWLHN